MKLPSRLRQGPTRRTGPRTVEVTLTADTSQFVGITADTSQFIETMTGVRLKLGELESIRGHRLRLAHERSLGMAHVGARSLGMAHVGAELDRMCSDLGMDPVVVWRAPRAREVWQATAAQVYRSHPWDEVA